MSRINIFSLSLSALARGTYLQLALPPAATVEIYERHAHDGEIINSKQGKSNAFMDRT
jgi:hypothetical protein